jgi:hypothetical protein
MAPQTSELDRAVFLTHLQYVGIAEAVRKSRIHRKTATNIKNRAAKIEIQLAEAGLPPLTIQELVLRKEGSGVKLKISIKEVTGLLGACTLNKKQRKKLWHVVAHEEGFFNLHRRTIEKKLRERGLRRCKATKKLGLTDIQRAQRYEVALSRKDWGIEEWRKVIFSDEASIIVSVARGTQKLSRFPDERHHNDCIDCRYNNYSEAMFWGCFTYDYKGPCYIYYPKTEFQKVENQDIIEALNDGEIEAECRVTFDLQEREKEERWNVKGQRWPTKRASWEVY